MYPQAKPCPSIHQLVQDERSPALGYAYWVLMMRLTDDWQQISRPELARMFATSENTAQRYVDLLNQHRLIRKRIRRRGDKDTPAFYALPLQPQRRTPSKFEGDPRQNLGATTYDMNDNHEDDDDILHFMQNQLKGIGFNDEKFLENDLREYTPSEIQGIITAIQQNQPANPGGYARKLLIQIRRDKHNADLPSKKATEPATQTPPPDSAPPPSPPDDDDDDDDDATQPAPLRDKPTPPPLPPAAADLPPADDHLTTAWDRIHVLLKLQFDQETWGMYLRHLQLIGQIDGLPVLYTPRPNHDHIRHRLDRNLNRQLTDVAGVPGFILMAADGTLHHPQEATHV